MADRFLTDYSAPFRYATDNWSVPEWQAKEYFALEKKAKKEGVTVSVMGTAVTRDNNGMVTIHQAGRGFIQFTSDAEWQAFLQVVNTIPQGGTSPLTGNYPGQTSAPAMTNHLENTDNPFLKQTMERNLQELEKWAVESSKAYPRHG